MGLCRTEQGALCRLRLSLLRKVLRLVTGAMATATLFAGSTAEPPIVADVIYTNIVDRRGPWSVHVVKVPRKGSFELRSVHARGRAIGLSELSKQAQLVSNETNEVVAVAAVNGDFYQRHGAHAGDPRGLQIVEGELVSSP